MAQEGGDYGRAVALVATGVSIRRAAKMTGTSRESLRRRVHGLVPITCRRGPQLVYLSEGANRGLLEIVEFRASRGLCIDHAQLRFLIREAALATSTRDVPPDFPDKTFMSRWLKKHSSKISVRKARLLEGKRAMGSTEDVVRYYFNNLQANIDKLGLMDRPEQIWNCDETGICAQGRCQQRVIAPKGMAANVQRSDDRENVSMMGCVNAAGCRAPPMYIFAGVYRKSSWLLDAPSGAVCAMTESSNINGPLFQQWLEWFVRFHLPPVRPQLLILDGHFAHIQYETVKWAMERNVHLFVLPAHTSHFLQPLDVGVFQPFRRLYERELKNFPNNATTWGCFPTRDDVVAVTKTPFECAFSSRNIRNGFKQSGICPLSLGTMLHGSDRDFGDHSIESKARSVKRQGLDLDALNLVNLAMKMDATPRLQKRRKDAYVDENYPGGVLMTHQDMLAALEKKEKDRRFKQSAKLSKPHEKIERELMNFFDKPEFFTTKTKKAMKPKVTKRTRKSPSSRSRASSIKSAGPKPSPAEKFTTSATSSVALV